MNNPLIKLMFILLIIMTVVLCISGYFNSKYITESLNPQTEKINESIHREQQLYNQIQYAIFLSDILDNNNIEYEYYQDFLTNYLYPNGELNKELNDKFIEMGY